MIKTYHLLAAAALSVALLTGCGSSSSAETQGSTSAGSGTDTAAAAAEPKDPLKIAVVGAKSGPYAAIGENMAAATRFAADQANAKGGVAGHKVQVTVLDGGETPATAVSAVEKAVLEEGSPFIIGPISSAQSIAVEKRVQGLDALQLVVVSKTDAVTGESCSSKTYRSNHNDAMDLAVLGPWLKGRKEKTWSIIAADYEWGHDGADAFTKLARADGRDVVKTVYAPLGTTDYGSFIGQLKSTPSDGLMVFLAGGDANNFAKQAQQFGLLDRYKVVIGVAFTTPSTVQATGDALDGVWGVVNYPPSLDTPANTAFVDAWKDAHDGELPTNYDAETYVGMQALLAAVEKADSVDPAAVGEALSGLTVDTIYGPVEVRASDHQMVEPNYVAQVVVDKNAPRGFRYEIALKGDPEQVTPPGDCQMSS